MKCLHLKRKRGGKLRIYKLPKNIKRFKEIQKGLMEVQ